MNNTAQNNEAIKNAAEFAKIAKPLELILSHLGEEALKYAGPVALAIAECKTCRPNVIAKIVETLEPGFEKISDQFFHYLESRNFESLILNDSSYTKEEKEEMLETVTFLKNKSFKQKSIIATGCVLSVAALAGTIFLANKGINSNKEIRLKELSLAATECRWFCFSNIASAPWNALTNIFNPIRGIKSIY